MVKLLSLRKELHGLALNPLDVDIILTETLKIDKSKLFFDISVSEYDEAIIRNNIQRLLEGEPVSYIVGYKEFMSLDFKVNSSTLIPRADTEVLVEEIIKVYKEKNPFIFEIGTGSGCIPISLAYYIEDAEIISCDISEKALETARINAKNNGVDKRTSFIRHDIMSGFPRLMKAPDCIVSNPPYIESNVIKTLNDNVKNFEPLCALDGGADGLDFYRKIITDNPLKKGGIMAFEIGYNQGQAVFDLMEKDFRDIKIVKDLGNNDRVVLGIKK